MIGLAAAKELQAVAPRGRKDMRLFAAIRRKESELDVLVGKQTLLLGIMKNGSPALDVLLRFAQLSEAVRWKYRHVLTLVRFALASPYGWAQAQAIVHAAMSLPLMARQATFIGAHDAATALGNQALELCKIAVQLSRETGPDQRAFAAVAALSVDHRDGSPARVWADSIHSELPSELKQGYEGVLKRVVRRHGGEVLEGDIVTSDDQLLLNLAWAMDPKRDPQ